MKNRLTLKDIAKKFDVSVGTVSKSLNDSYEISPKTKEKIRAYAKKHNYKPNSIALSLRNSQSNTKTIGVVIPSIMNRFFLKVFAGIEEVTTERNYTLISCISNDSYEKEVKATELLKSGVLDGIIISIAEETEVKQSYEHLKDVIDEGIPMVLFDRVTNEVECDKVIIDDFDAAYNATNHLINSGCKNIAVVSILHAISIGKLRIEGYRKALKESNSEQSEIIIKIDKKEDFNKNLRTALSTNSIDGLLCLEESSALKSLKILKSLKYKTPEDVSIISFSNGKLPRYVTPTVTTVSQHGRIVGKKAAEMLIKRLEKDKETDFKTKIVKTTLVERESTR